MQEITILKSGLEFVKILGSRKKDDHTSDVDISYSEDFGAEAKRKYPNLQNSLALFTQEVMLKAVSNKDGYEIEPSKK